LRISLHSHRAWYRIKRFAPWRHYNWTWSKRKERLL
uniref:Group II intron reverse transcriptase/maturase n=1 Tax=Haemonchus placei TaxID=6290 RepID=A0A0N4X0R2_HAEPC